MLFKPDSDGFNGAIHHLWSKHRSEYAKYVFASSSSIYNDLHNWATSPGVIIDYSLPNDITSNILCTNNQNKENISIHFFQNTLFITHYSLLNRNVMSDHFPRSWQLDGSNDNETWYSIDSKSNVEELNGADKKITVPVSYPGKYQYFRFTNVDKVWRYNGQIGDYYFCLAKVEFFGTLYSNKITCEKNPKPFHSFILNSLSLFIIILK